nr:hypothetical protein Iba_chr13bCG3690 [Ipomoea batatas]
MPNHNPHRMHCRPQCLVAFNVLVNPPHKQIRPQVPNRTCKYPQTEAEHQSVSKIKAGLEEARHLGLYMVVIYRIEVHVKSSGCSREERSPLPMVILGIKQEICAHDCHTHCDNYQNNKNQKHEPIHQNYLVIPEGSEHKIHLNENASKRKETTHERNNRWC